MFIYLFYKLYINNNINKNEILIIVNCTYMNYEQKDLIRETKREVGNARTRTRRLEISLNTESAVIKEL